MLEFPVVLPMELNNDRVKLFVLSVLYGLDTRPEITQEELEALFAEEILYRDYECQEIRVNISKDCDKPQLSDMDQFLADYRALFKGIRLGSMGDPNAVRRKMFKFMTDNPKYSKQEILDAATNYIKLTDRKYVRRADYFISKQEEGRGSEASLLLAVLEDGIKAIQRFTSL